MGVTRYLPTSWDSEDCINIDVMQAAPSFWGAPERKLPNRGQFARRKTVGGWVPAGPSRVQWTGPKMKLAEEEMTHGLETRRKCSRQIRAASDCREVSIKDRGNEQAAVDSTSIGELSQKRFRVHAMPLRSSGTLAAPRHERPV